MWPYKPSCVKLWQYKTKKEYTKKKSESNISVCSRGGKQKRKWKWRQQKLSFRGRGRRKWRWRKSEGDDGSKFSEILFTGEQELFENIYTENEEDSFGIVTDKEEDSFKNISADDKL